MDGRDRHLAARETVHQPQSIWDVTTIRTEIGRYPIRLVEGSTVPRTARMNVARRV